MKKIVLMSVLLVGAILFMPDVSSTYIYNPDAWISYTLNETDTSSWELFTWVWTITYQDWDITITILDRNLWATATGSCGDLDFRTNKCSNTPSPLSYGYKFQRGNNWWFDSNKLIDSISGLVSSALVSPGYSTWILYEWNYGWDTSWIDEYRPDLWWWDDYIEYDWNNYKLSLENAEKKQWPCPDWWHIPTYYEMSQIIHQAPLLFNSKELFLPEKDLGWFSETWYSGYKYWRETWYSGYKYWRVKNDHWVRFEYSNVSSNSLHPIRCFYNYYELYPRVVSAYDEWAMMWSWLVDAWSAISWDIVTQYLTWLTKQWYTFNWRLISGSNEEFDPENDIVTTWLILNADRTINQYTITFNTDWWSEVAPITWDYWTWITKPDDPTKNWYTFDWWKPSIPETMPAENLTITAQWKKKSGWWSWWGGGWGWSWSSSSHGSADDNTPQWTWDSQDSSADKSASEWQTWSVVDSSAEPQNDSSVSSWATAKDLSDLWTLNYLKNAWARSMAVLASSVIGAPALRWSKLTVKASISRFSPSRQRRFSAVTVS